MHSTNTFGESRYATGRLIKRVSEGTGRTVPRRRSGQAAGERLPLFLMSHLFQFLIPIALGAVLITLCVGIFALFKGGDFGRSYSNKLMRLRVALQFLAVIVLMTAVWWKNH